jgi:predicted RNase H-like HicB family nuclease
MPHRYHINLFWSDKDESWIADVPELTCCPARDPTRETTLAGIQIAISAWLAVQAPTGRRAPYPWRRRTL